MVVENPGEASSALSVSENWSVRVSVSGNWSSVGVES